MKTIKIKPSHESQGDHVLINEEDFNPDLHEVYEAPAADAAEKPRAKPGPKPKVLGA